MLKIAKNIIYIAREYNYGEISSKAAEMSFYLLLSFFPLLIFIISSIVYTPIIRLNYYIILMGKMIPSSAFDLVSSIIQSAVDNRSLNFLIVSFFLTLWTLSRCVRGFIRGVNRSYRIKETRSFIKISIISLVFIIVLLILIFLSIILLVYGQRIGYLVFELIGLDYIFLFVWDICRYTIGISTVIIVLISLYTLSPNINIQIKHTLPGAFISAFGWLIVSFVYSYYINNFSNHEVIYGSISGVIALLTWIYLSSWALVIGSEVNAKLYFRRNINKTKTRISSK